MRSTGSTEQTRLRGKTLRWAGDILHAKHVFFSRSANVFASFLFCAILTFIDLTKKCVGGNIQIKEMPDTVGRLHNLAIKPPHVVRQGGFTFYSSLSFR